MVKLAQALSSSVFFLCLLLTARTSSAAERPNHLVVYTEQFPPYSYIKDNVITGINIEIVKMLCDKTALHCEFHLVPWTRAFESAKHSRGVGVVSTSRSPDREAFFQWVGPLVSSQTFFYRLSKRDDIVIETIEDATHYTIGIPREDVYEKELQLLGFKKGYNLLETSSKRHAVKLLLLGRLDLIVGSDNTLPNQIAPFDIESNELVPTIAVPIYHAKGNFLAINKEYDAKIVALLQKYTTELKQSGVFESLRKKHVIEAANL